MNQMIEIKGKDKEAFQVESIVEKPPPPLITINNSKIKEYSSNSKANMNKKNSILQYIGLSLVLFSTSLIEKSQAIILPCNDDPVFSFGGYMYKGRFETRTCEWITNNPQRTEARQNSWCDKDNVGEKCPEACSKCPKTTLISIIPPCFDDPAFSFGGYEYMGKFETRTCEWITANPQRTQVRQDNWCNKDDVGEKCPESCNKCPAPPEPMCEDKSQPYSFSKWHDSGGATFNCEWYATRNETCKLFGDKFENFNMTANEACCTCGGGWLIVA